MNFIVVTNDWLSARGIIPLPTMRKSKDGTKIILHEDYFNFVAGKDEEGNIDLEGATFYAHNSAELNELLSSDEWTWSEEEAPTESADYIQVAAVRNLMVVTKSGINTMALNDDEALKVKDMYPEWTPGIEVKTGEKYQHEGWLWRVVQDHTTQDGWEPSMDTASLWERIDEEHAGTLEDPIPYTPPMEIFKDKYYTQDGVTYLCTRDSETPLSYNMTELVGLYVEVV